MTALLYLFGMADPLHTKSYFLLRLCFVSDYTNDYTGWEVWHKLQRVEPPLPPPPLRYGPWSTL